MLHTIKGVLNAEQLQVARDLLARGRFHDGRLSAGDMARAVKNNEEVEPSSLPLDQLNNLVMGALVRNPEYAAVALPGRVAAPFYARYQPGMTYGDHVDDPVMGPPNARYRSDVSITIFLSSRDSYDGGELVIRTSFGEQQVKLDAGDAVLYPSSSLHHVAEVTRGERLVAVTWVQSLVRDPAQRELLFELASVRDALIDSDPEDARRISNVHANLVRMWSEL